MRVHVTASTGKTVAVWRDSDLFSVRPEEIGGDTQVCLGVDLFEVIAELAQLDLERNDEAAEALSLADTARVELMLAREQAEGDDDYDDELSADGVP
jgi:hypothetical protein